MKNWQILTGAEGPGSDLAAAREDTTDMVQGWKYALSIKSPLPSWGKTVS
jgi:hypothetical protein